MTTDAEDTGANVSQRSADDFKFALRFIAGSFDCADYLLAMGILGGFSMAQVGEAMGESRQVMAHRFKVMRDKQPIFRKIIDWTGHGGAVAADNAGQRFVQSEMFV